MASDDLRRPVIDELLYCQILEVSIFTIYFYYADKIFESTRTRQKMPSLLLYQKCCSHKSLLGLEQLRVARVMDKNRERMSDH